MELFKIEECYGNKGCPNSINSTKELIKKIEEIAKKEKIEEFILSKVKGPVRQHHAFRVGISNCPNACSHVQIKDFGIIGKIKIKINKKLCINCGKCVKGCFEGALTFNNKKLTFHNEKCIGCGMCVKLCKEEAIKIVEKGFQVLAGGKLGRHPMLANEISNFATLNEVIDIFKKILIFYKNNSIYGERLGAIFQRLNVDSIKLKALTSID